MIRRIHGLLRWLFWSVIGGGWCLRCQFRLWTGPRLGFWIPPIYCPNCHGFLRFNRAVKPLDFTTSTPAASTRAELEAAAGIVEGPIQ